MKNIVVDNHILSSLLTLSSVIEARDSYTGGHIWRVSQYARILAEKIGFSKDDVFIVELGGLVHDLGKVGISDSILNKKDTLSDTEFMIMRKHTELGQNLIANHPLADLVEDAIHNHHERIDGKGYPKGSQETQISNFARIISIADAFDAMTSVRPYRKSMNAEKAYSIIASEKGKQFDSPLAEAFIQLGNNGKLSHILGHCGDEKLLLSCPGCGPVIVPETNSNDGDNISCPTCTGEFRMHKQGDTYDLQFKGSFNTSPVPKPDNDLITSIINKFPKQLKPQEM